MPFGPYKNMRDCISKNQDKDKPAAYCATIMRKIENPNQYSVERFYDGQRLQLHKSGTCLAIFDEEGTKVELSDSFNPELLNLTPSDYILEGEMTKEDGKIHISDILYLDDEDIRIYPWIERMSILKGFTYGETIRPIHQLIVKNEEERKLAIKTLSELSGSNGVIVKPILAEYGETATIHKR